MLRWITIRIVRTLLIGWLITCGSVWGQISRGGAGDGADVTALTNTSSIFLGGNGNGFGYASLANEVSIFLGNTGSGFSTVSVANGLDMYIGGQENGANSAFLANGSNLFQGGTSNGFDGKILLNGLSTYTGGTGDGQGWNEVVTGNGLYSGGMGDGYFSKDLANTEGGTVFHGGASSGFDLTTSTNANNLFNGGSGDGFNLKEYYSTVSLFGGGLGSGFHSILFQNSVLLYSGGEGQGFHMAYFAFGTALPVEWISFTAERMSESEVQLNWTVLEKNNEYFEVLRSDEVSSDFVSLGRLTGNGTSDEFTAYDFLDESSSAAICYYKLKQVDYDGTIDMSHLLVVTNSRVSQDIVAMYPNPTATFTNLFVGKPKSFEFRLYQASGQLVLRKTVENQEGTPIQVGQLPSGIYWLQVLFSDKIWRSRLIIEK